MSLDDMNGELARRAAAESLGGDAPPVMERRIYPDGSERHGCAPFPDLSPLEEQAAKARAANAVPGQDAFARAQADAEAAQAAAAAAALANTVTAAGIEATNLDATPPSA